MCIVTGCYNLSEMAHEDLITCVLFASQKHFEDNIDVMKRQIPLYAGK